MCAHARDGVDTTTTTTTDKHVSTLQDIETNWGKKDLKEEIEAMDEYRSIIEQVRPAETIRMRSTTNGSGTESSPDLQPCLG